MMTSRLETLEEWVANLLSQLEPASRNRLARSIGQALRRSQQQRIIAQRNPNGIRYTPRKQRDLKAMQGRAKRKAGMFQKIRTAGFLKFQRDRNALSVGFTGRIARIARVHQDGLRDRAERGATDVKYCQRQLLGLTDSDLDLIRESLRKHLSL